MHSSFSADRGKAVPLSFFMCWWIQMWRLRFHCSSAFLLFGILGRLRVMIVTFPVYFYSLRKHAYSNILKILSQKTENFQIKTLIFSYFCSKHRLWVLVTTASQPPRRGGSNEYPQSMCLSKNKKNNVYPCKPLFYYIKVGFKGV